MEYEGRNHKKEFNKWLWILTVLSYYVLCELKTQEILTRKRNWKRKYEWRNHKKKFNNWLWYLSVLSYYVLGGLKNTEDFKHERGIEKENMREES